MKRVDIKTGFLCNNNCYFCVQAQNKCSGNRSLDEIKNDLLESKKTCDAVVLTGGEVTIRKDFFDIVKYAKQLGYKQIQIQTNGRMFSDIDFCKKTIKAGANEFSPAVHGYCAEQHDFLVRVNGAFKQVVKGIINLKSLNQKIIMNSVIVKSNYRDLEKIAKLFVKLKVDQFQFAFVHALGSAETNFDMVMPNMTLAANEVKKALDVGIRNKIPCMAEGFTFCVMDGYEKYLSEHFIPDTQIRGRDFQNTDDYKTQRLVDGKVKFDCCNGCKYDNICEGSWKEYPEKKGVNEFIKVENE